MLRILNPLVEQGLLPAAGRQLIVEKILTVWVPQYVQPGVPIINNEKPFLLLLRSFWSYKAFWTSLVPLFIKRIYYPLTSRLGAAIKKAVIKVVDKLLKVHANAQREQLAGQLASLGLNSWLPAQCALRNPQYIAIGRRFISGDNLRLEAIEEPGTTSAQPKVVIGDDVEIGVNVHISSLQHVYIGNNVRLSNRVYITDHALERTAQAREQLPRHRKLKSAGPVRIESRVLIEEGVCIFGGVTIGENAIVLAGSVVDQDVPAHTIVGGNPARELVASPALSPDFNIP
ncbi:acyltransferase [Hymenobacter sp. BT175]|nr:acyltransferase [Hymenobacter translucens]MCC2547917.1 acyltransferase [Hymenobacter translucens]